MSDFSRDEVCAVAIAETFRGDGEILVSPIGDQLLLDFSKALVNNEKLGQDEFPDYLSISFSAVDAVNHFFGPSSLENEDVVVQLDRTLANLFAFIDKTVGLKLGLKILH